MTRRPLALFGAALLALALGFGNEARADGTKLVAETDWAPHGMIGGLILAKEKGWFKEAGLDVDVLDGKGSNTTIQQTAAGTVDIGFAQLSAMAAAVSNGLPVTSVMGLVQAGDAGLMVPVDSGWTKLQDLKGKRLLIPAGSATATFLDAFITAAGMTPGDFTVTNIDSSAETSLFVNGQGDAALSTVSYFLPSVAKTRPAKPILFSSVGLSVPGYGLLVRKSLLKDNPDAVRKFVEVQQHAWTYIFAGHEQEAVDAILAERAGMRLDPEVLLAQLKLDLPYFTTPATKGKPLGWQAATDWENALKAMRDVGVVKTPLTPDDVRTNALISDRYTLAQN